MGLRARLIVLALVFAVVVSAQDGPPTNNANIMTRVDTDNHLVVAAEIRDPNTTTQKAAVSASGALKVECSAGCSGGASFADNSAFTFGTTNINPTGYVFDDVAPNAVTENNAAAPRMSGNRVPYSILRDAAGNERGANVTAGNALTVDGSAVTQPVSAASLPLPTGASTLAEQQTQTTSLSVLDDWDESDRAKVNPIVGQAGVQGGSGTVSATTQRMVLATDVGLPTGTNSIGVVSTKTALSYNAPTACAVGASNGQCLASNASRRGLIAVNTSNNTISCSVGQTSVLNSGVTLQAGAVWNMNEYSYGTGAVNCIASSAGSNLSLQEIQ